MTLYATLADAREELNASNTVDDAKLLRNLRVVSRRIDAEMFSPRRPFFAPYIESDDFALLPQYVNTYQRTFRFTRPLLALTGVTVGTDSLTVNTDVKAWLPLDTPIYKLILSDTAKRWYDYCDSNSDPLRVIIAGTWGFHRSWADAWLDVETVQDNPLSSSATTLTVSDVDGADAYGRTPAISAGALLKIESEYLEVTATNTASNTCTVRRGVNGSTAAAHVQTTTVSVFQVEEDIRQVTARQAAFMYARIGAFTTAQITAAGTMTFQKDLLFELKAVLAGYAYD